MQMPQLRHYREEKKLSRESLAFHSGCSVSTIHRLEKGGVCNGNTGARIAYALNVKVELLEKEAPHD